MAGQEEQLLIAFQSIKLPEEDVSWLWRLVVDAAAEQLPDEISIEGPVAPWEDVPVEVEPALQHLLAGIPLDRRPRRWQWRKISPGAFDQAKLAGPWVVGLNLYRSGLEVAGISDYGMDIVVTVPESRWGSLAAVIKRDIGVLPPHDITPLAGEYSNGPEDAWTWDNIIKKLSEQARDNRFLRLIRKVLDACPLVSSGIGDGASDGKESRNPS